MGEIVARTRARALRTRLSAPLTLALSARTASSLDYVTGYLLAEWMTAMGLFDQRVVDATSAELTEEELERWLIEVPSPRGMLTRLRPVIGYSDGTLADLPPWRASGSADTAWLG